MFWECTECGAATTAPSHVCAECGTATRYVRADADDDRDFEVGHLREHWLMVGAAGYARPELVR